MDELLARVSAQTLNYCIRTGIALTSTYAVGQCSRLLKTVDDSGVRAELRSLKKRLDVKIKVCNMHFTQMFQTANSS